MKTKNNTLRNVLIFTAVVVLLIALFVFGREVHERELFFPSKHPAVPDGMIGNAVKKDIELKLLNGEKLRGWILEEKNSRDCLLYFYGNGDSVYTSGNRMAAIADLFNINVICFDYRGYSYSDGEPSLDNILADSLAIYDYAANKYVNNKGHIITYGQSLGTISALNVAVNRKVDGCILEATFTTAEKAIFEMGWNNIPFPINLFVRLRPEKSLLTRKPQQIDQVRKLTAPILFVHCVTDNFFPLYMAKEMLKDAGSSEKSLTLVHGCRHYPLPIAPGTEEYIGMKDFFDKIRK